MINCRSAGSRVGRGNVFIDNLLRVRTAREGITKPSMAQEAMEIGEGIYGHPRDAQAEPLARVAIQHPGRNDNDLAGGDDDMRDSAVRPVLDVLASNGPLEIRMPPIPHDDVAPDMGRMSARWQ